MAIGTQHLFIELSTSSLVAWLIMNPQLIGLLEYEQKYESGIPWELIPPTLGLLYLPRSNPSSFASRKIIKNVFGKDGVKVQI